jgi:glycosyltransferase involved in cell wall biosynthesis
VGADAISVGRPAGSARPLVSVVVPVLNGEAHLRQSLDSILDQTYQCLEVIVMDDGSTDATSDIVASYRDRIEYVRQASTRGIYGNANDGIGRARGELIGVFHADDVYEPDMVEREVEWLARHRQAGAVFCSDTFIDAAGAEFGRLRLPPELRGNRPLDYSDVLNALLRHTNVFLRCPTALVRASVYRELGRYRDTEFKNTSDLEMWLRIARSYPIGVLEEHLLRYRRGHGSSSERYHSLRTEPFRFFRIVDLELEGGGREFATTAALRAYEAHRNEDTLLRAVNHYIVGDRDGLSAALRELRLRALIGSAAVQRARLVSLGFALRLLVCLPRISALARLFDRRWNGGAGIPTLAGNGSCTGR